MKDNKRVERFSLSMSVTGFITGFAMAFWGPSWAILKGAVNEEFTAIMQVLSGASVVTLLSNKVSAYMSTRQLFNTMFVIMVLGLALDVYMWTQHSTVAVLLELVALSVFRYAVFAHVRDIAKEKAIKLGLDLRVHESKLRNSWAYGSIFSVPFGIYALSHLNSWDIVYISSVLFWIGTMVEIFNQKSMIEH